MKRVLLLVATVFSVLGIGLGIYDVKALNSGRRAQKNCVKSESEILNNGECKNNSDRTLEKNNSLHLPKTKSEKKKKERKYIFIGDSRTLNLSTEKSKYKDTDFFCKVGASYRYMQKAFNMALIHCDKEKENVIVSWFGINNPMEVKKYITYYNTVSLPENVKLVVLSITDGCDSKGRAIEIEEFNGLVQDNAENYKFLDITDKVGNGKELNVTDAARLHYTKNADKVLKVIMDKLSDLELN